MVRRGDAIIVLEILLTKLKQNSKDYILFGEIGKILKNLVEETLSVSKIIKKLKELFKMEESEKLNMILRLLFYCWKIMVQIWLRIDLILLLLLLYSF